MRRARAALALAVVALAGSCARESESELRGAGWAKRDIVAAAPEIYCYSTLAAKDCHAAPAKGQEYRYVMPQAPVAGP